MAGILSFLSSFWAHQLTFHGGWNCWWLWHHLSTDMAGNVPFLMSEAECGWEPEENFVLHKWNSMKGSSKWFRIYFKEWKRTREMFNSKISKNANNLSFCFHLGSLLCKRNCSLGWRLIWNISWKAFLFSSYVAHENFHEPHLSQNEITWAT